MSQSNLAERLPTSAAEVVLPNIGEPFGGGFYAGRIVIDDKPHALVVAPKAEGELGGVWWKSTWDATAGASSLNDGFANSEAMNDPEHPAARWCRSLTIGSFTDWYLPSRDELEVLYRNLKPGTVENYTYASRAKAWGVAPGEYNGVDEGGNGSNESSEPAGAPYTADSPAQTAAEAFRTGGSEAFEERFYWSSTEFDPGYAWGQLFSRGYQGHNDKNDGFRCRAVRKVILI